MMRRSHRAQITAAIVAAVRDAEIRLLETIYQPLREPMTLVDARAAREIVITEMHARKVARAKQHKAAAQPSPENPNGR